MEQIIEFVKENALLYDTHRPMYKDSRAKDRKWKELAVNNEQRQQVEKSVYIYIGLSIQ